MFLSLLRIRIAGKVGVSLPTCIHPLYYCLPEMFVHRLLEWYCCKITPFVAVTTSHAYTTMFCLPFVCTIHYISYTFLNKILPFMDTLDTVSILNFLANSKIRLEILEGWSTILQTLTLAMSATSVRTDHTTLKQ